MSDIPRKSRRHRRGRLWTAALCCLFGLRATASGANPSNLSLQVDFQGFLMVTNLAATSGPGIGEISLQWSAPGYSGAAPPLSYEIRVSSVGSVQDPAEFAAAQPLAAFSPASPPGVAAGGTPQSLLVTGLSPGQSYCFGLQGVDNNSPPAKGGWWRVPTSGFNTVNCAAAGGNSPSGVFVVSGDSAPATILQGTTNQLFLTLTMNTTANSVLMTQLELVKLGTLPDADVTAARVYYDADGSGGLSPLDELLSSGASPFTSGKALMTLSPAQTIGLSPRRYLIALGLADYADYTKTVGVSVASTASFVVPAPHFIVDNGYPKNSSAAAVVKVPETLVATASSLLLSDVIQGLEAAAFSISVHASRQSVVWNRLTLPRLGSLPDASVQAVNLYRESGGGQIFIGSAPFSAGIAVIDFSSAQTVGLSTLTYTVALKLSPSAAVGATIGALIQDATAFRVIAPDAASLTPAPVQAGLVSVLDGRTPTRPVVTLPDGPYSPSFESVNFVWSSTVGIGFIASAQYAIGTTPGGVDVVAWTAMSATPGPVGVDGLLLVNGSTYYASVRATSDSGFTSLVGISSAQIVDAFEPGKPSGLSALVGLSSIIANWSPVVGGISGVRGYLLEYSKADVPVWRNSRTKAITAYGVSNAAPAAGASAAELVQSPFTVTGIERGTLLFRVRAVSGAGLSGPYSDVLRVQYGGLAVASIEDESAYPNPFDSRRGRITIAFNLAAASEVSVKIYSIYGIKLREFTLAGMSGVNLLSWDGAADSGRKVSKGMYLAVITAGGAKKTLKIGVIH